MVKKNSFDMHEKARLKSALDHQDEDLGFLRKKNELFGHNVQPMFGDVKL